MKLITITLIIFCILQSCSYNLYHCTDSETQMRLYPSTKHFRIYDKSLRGKPYLSGKYSLRDSMIHFKFYPVNDFAEVKELQLGSNMGYRSQYLSSISQKDLAIRIGTKYRPIYKAKVNLMLDGEAKQSVFTDTLGYANLEDISKYDALAISHEQYQAAYIPLTHVVGNELAVTLEKVNYNSSIGPLNISYYNMEADTIKNIYSGKSTYVYVKPEKKKSKMKKQDEISTDQIAN